MKIKLNNLTLKYDDETIIENQSITFEKGKINAIIGQNGSGKTTIFKSLCKHLNPVKGNITINDLNITKIKNKEFAKTISILFQENIAPNDITVEKLVSYGRFPHLNIFSELSDKDKNIIENSLKITGIENIKHKKLDELSSGQKQMVWISMLLAQETNVILLDEPTTYLDLKNQFQIMNCIKKINEKLNKTIILILHDINLVSLYSDYIFMLKNKKIKYNGKTNEILTKETIKDIFEINVSIYKENNKTLIIPIN